MDVSVVIPCHNSLRYLPETLDSVLAQELPDSVDHYEVVLVDDGGDDDLEGWAIARGDERVRVVRQPNAGVSAARNLGISSSSSDVVAFCDSDDVWVPTTVEHLVSALLDDGCNGMAYGWYGIIDGDGRSTGSIHRGRSRGWVWRDLVLANPVCASGVVVRRTVLDDVGGFDVNRHRFPVDVEDWELWIRIAARWPVGLSPNVVCWHRRHDSNSTRDVASLELAYGNLFDVVFADIAPPQRSLRPIAEASASMTLGWQWLNDRGDLGRAEAHLRRARSLDPGLRRSPAYWRLALASKVRRWGGERAYRTIRSVTRSVRCLRTRSDLRQR